MAAVLVIASGPLGGGSSEIMPPSRKNEIAAATTPRRSRSEPTMAMAPPQRARVAWSTKRASK